MHPHTQAPSALARLTPAHQVITPELLAALARVPLDSASRLHRCWFGAAAWICSEGFVVVSNDFVIGPPTPLVLEAAARLRVIHEAELNGEFDDEYEEYEEYDEFDGDEFDDDEFDDGGAPVRRDPPTATERLLAEMQCFKEAQRLRPGSELGALVASMARREGSFAPVDMIEFAVGGLFLGRMLAAVGSFVRVGDAMVADARSSDVLDSPLRRLVGRDLCGRRPLAPTLTGRSVATELAR